MSRKPKWYGSEVRNSQRKYFIILGGGSIGIIQSLKCSVNLKEMIDETTGHEETNKPRKYEKTSSNWQINDNLNPNHSKIKQLDSYLTKS
jgi:hypothetical protein